jgi:hypothetical protein
MFKRIIITSISIICAINLSAQSIEAISPSYKFNITKEVKPPILSIVAGSLKFTDANSNNAIDAIENCTISFTIVNNGFGDGYDLKLVSNANGNTQGVNFQKSLALPEIGIKNELKVELPITSNKATQDGSIIFAMQITEPNGFGIGNFELEISTIKFNAPLVKVVDYTITSQSGSSLSRKVPFDLQTLVQNVKNGVAENVNTQIELPAGVVCISANEANEIGTLNGGEKKSTVYTLIVSDNFTGETIPLKIKVKEKLGEYSRDTTIAIALNQSMSAQKITVSALKNNEAEKAIVTGSLGSDVDKNIPSSATPNEHRYAIIIGNEDYQSYQTGLSTEINVDFAANDASIFKEYAIKTLGIPADQIRYAINIKSIEFKKYLDFISRSAAIEKGNAELFFYYAGHGLPKEGTNEPFLIPVDVNGQDLEGAIALSEVYKKLTENTSKKVTVFLDACFSGGGRNQGLVAMRGMKLKPKEENAEGNMVVFSSSSGSETSGPFPEQQHGLFTYYLLKKMQESKGQFTYKDLSDYLEKQVQKKALLLNKPQTPQVKASIGVQGVWEGWILK